MREMSAKVPFRTTGEIAIGIKPGIHGTGKFPGKNIR